MDKTVSIVRKATDSNHANSTGQSLAIPARPAAPTETEACSISTDTEQITINSGYEVSTDSGFGSTLSSNATISPSTALYARQAAVANISFHSAVQNITAPSRGATPSVGINYADETLITTEAMEYSTDSGTNWTDCTETMAATTFGWDGSASVNVQFRTRPHHPCPSCRARAGDQQRGGDDQQRLLLQHRKRRL